jgi:hypothetical protein
MMLSIFVEKMELLMLLSLLLCIMAQELLLIILYVMVNCYCYF